MVLEIHLDKVHELDEANTLGYFPKREDFDHLITEDCDVFLPDGTKVLVFRKKAITHIANYTERQWTWWKWVARRYPSIGRGAAAGKEIHAQTWRRITKATRAFILQAKKGKFNDATEQEIQEFLQSDTRWDLLNYVISCVREDGLYDAELCAPYEKRIKRLKHLPIEEQREIADFLVENRAKVWFNNWLEREFLPAPPEKRPEVALYCFERYFGRESFNEVHSGVAGAMDRQIMVPYARLTVTTEPPKYLYDPDGRSMFEVERPFYKEVDALFAEHMPEERKKLQDVWGNLKEPEYCLYGTSFSTITVYYFY